MGSRGACLSACGWRGGFELHCAWCDMHCVVPTDALWSLKRRPLSRRLRCLRCVLRSALVELQSAWLCLHCDFLHQICIVGCHSCSCCVSEARGLQAGSGSVCGSHLLLQSRMVGCLVGGLVLQHAILETLQHISSSLSKAAQPEAQHCIHQGWAHAADGNELPNAPSTAHQVPCVHDLPHRAPAF